ncbi:MAG: hypothetical protein U1F68_21315 [Gammaproteobacteria bacterium]
MALAWILVDHWRPDRLNHHGDLLQPAQPVTSFTARRLDGQPLDSRYFHHHWTLVVADPGADCAERCRKALYYARQIRLALGKDLARVQTLFLAVTAPSADFSAWFAQEHAAMTLAVANTDTVQMFTAAFPPVPATDSRIFLLDPLGNLLLRYSVDTDPKGIIQDMERLLKYSAIR